MGEKQYLDDNGLNYYHKGISDILDKNLNGDFVENNEFTFRATDGITSIKTGTAYLERIKGNTVKWNQLLRANKLVDMGLPSGTLWATCDIDVTKADKFCETPFTYEKSFFSWGNTDGHNPIGTGFAYDFGGVNGAAPWYEGQVYGETQGNTLTSDIPQNAVYDAARANLGAPWRMPTSAEFNELFANIKYINADGTEVDTTKTDKRVSVNGVMGLYIESRINGARLFFSCSGHGNGRSWHNRGANGNYRASTFNSARYARNLDFSSGGVAPQNLNTRYNGFAIRPVTNSAIVTDENGHKYAVSGKYIIDLTLMYGEGNEPSTIAQFEADYFKWFGKPLTSEGYTEGELRDVKMSAIKTIGFNAFNLSTGKAKLIGGQEYEVVGTYTSLTIDGESVTLVDGKFTPAQSCELVVTGGDSTTCVHLVHSGKRSGESESYWEETKNVPVTTLTGKLNGEGESVIVFPDGMKSVGDAHDDIYIENGKTDGIKRIGSNDLGDYNYTKQGNLYTTDFVPANANMISGRGKAVVWNQLLESDKWIATSSAITTVGSETHLIAYSQYGRCFYKGMNASNAYNVYIVGHKYIWLWKAKVNEETNQQVVAGVVNWFGAAMFSEYLIGDGEWHDYSMLRTARTGLNSYGVFGFVDKRSEGWTEIAFKDVVSFDLTQMFGAGNEPATVEEFRAMFPEDYYEYDTGSLGIVADATYPDAASFKAAMAGVSLYHELATPLIYELDNFQLPLPYRVDDYGTEEIKGAEKSVAPTLDIRYGINIIDTIRNLPKTIDSIEEEISDANDGIDDAFDAIDTKEDKLAFSSSASAVPPSTAMTFAPSVNHIYYQHERTPVIGNPNIVLPVPTTERATIKIIYRNSTADAPTITSEEGVNVIIESNITGVYRLTTINCEWYHDCWVVNIQTHGT